MTLLQRLKHSFAGRCIGSFVEFQGVDRAMAIAAQAFTALIPLLLLVSAFAPRDNQNLVADGVIGKFELSGSAAAAVRQVFAHSGEASTGVLSVLLLLFSGVSLARRMQRMYLQAWGLEPRTGPRGSFNAALGLTVLLLEIALLAAARSLVRQLPADWVLGAPLLAFASLVLWTSVPWLLLDRRVHWRRLLPAGALAAIGTSVYGVASTIYMPRLLESYNERYGLFGVTLSLVGWLLCVSLIIVATTVVAAELDRSAEPWARRLRTRFGLDKT